MQLSEAPAANVSNEAVIDLIRNIYVELQPDASFPSEDFRVIPLDERSWLVQFEDDGQPTALRLQMAPAPSHNGHSLAHLQGQLFRSNHEYLQFGLRLVLPENEQTQALHEDQIVALQGLYADPEGNVAHFHDTHPAWEEELRECSSCQSKMPLSYWERKVGDHRCWRCTGIAIGIGLAISGTAAWASQTLMQVLGVQGGDALRNIAYLILGVGTAYTAWRAAFWGYLPYQNWVAWWIDQSTSRRKES